MKVRIIRKTDQWNNEDFAEGSRIFTVSIVTAGKEQAPYDIHFSDGDGKCWRPSNGMLELLVACWGDESQAWSGRKVELFRDPGVRMARDVVGGIRVRSISHIDKPMSPLITVSRGTKKPYTVKPLSDAPDPAQEVIAALDAATTIPELQAAWENAGAHKANPAVIAAKDAKKAELAGQ